MVFTYLGHEVRIRDPKDVMLVGSPEDEVEAWIMEYFGFLLSTLDEKEVLTAYENPTKSKEIG